MRRLVPRGGDVRNLECVAAPERFPTRTFGRTNLRLFDITRTFAGRGNNAQDTVEVGEDNAALDSRRERGARLHENVHRVPEDVSGVQRIREHNEYFAQACSVALMPTPCELQHT